jgi:glycosyltransferase involved in cell wall biosynthesis
MQHASLPTVSVVIPAYNAEGYVRDAVTSAIRQTYPLQELVCVDDGSADGTLKVLRRLESQHPEQIQILTGPNRGASVARNRGMERVTSDYIQFLDADDTLLPEKLRRDIEVLVQNRSSILFGGYESFEVEEKVHECDSYVSDDPWICLANQNFGHTSANLFRADAVEQAGGWDEQRPFNQDYDLIARLLMEGGDVAFAQHKSTRVRCREASISAKWGKEMRVAQAELDREVLHHLRANGSPEERIAGVENAVFMKLRRLYQLDSETAVRLYHETFPDGYTPVVGGGNTTAYCAIYRMLGFSAAERIRTAYRKFRSRSRTKLSK